MDKDIRFTEKRVDEDWKESASRESAEPAPPSGDPKPPLSLSAFLTSLGYQTLIHLGEIPHPETKEAVLDLQGAKETIDLLILLEQKTKGNRTAEEEQLLKHLLPELQMKFVEKAK